ncbi:Cell-division-associated, ABC-transporter-like signaling protein FtsE [hydrothermal vent metagenome]|uniref:Cell division ATP-binding protein FtsE n=1 Tax=hydrothermal vent metagenome TaxID=652676 RepID=A0A3B0VYZ5_9ZZZZ
MISFNRVSKKYGKDNKALSDVSFTIEAGEMLFLTGHSGAGKTTILRLLMLMQSASYGQITVKGQNLSSLNSSKIATYRRNIGMIFQDHRLLNNKTVLENIALSLQIRGYSDSASYKLSRAALVQVGIGEKANFFPLELSSGQQQRVGIARAFVAKPDIILADEPTGNLDPDLSLELMQIFENLNKQGTTILIASHDLFLIKRLQKRVLVLDKGELIDDFSPQNDMYSP